MKQFLCKWNKKIRCDRRGVQWYSKMDELGDPKASDNHVAACRIRYRILGRGVINNGINHQLITFKAHQPHHRASATSTRDKREVKLRSILQKRMYSC